jgi:UDP-GlcNAc:undecaprenyl-phosphate/decaprenyl-phosphate GlcNAc-1-phosphate transferase
MYSYLLAFSTALIISLFMTRSVREWAKRKGWVDKPDGKRKLHALPTPRIGGLGLYLAFVIALFPIFLLHTHVADYLRAHFFIFAYIILFSGLVMLIGLWDDLRNISPWKKFTAQSVVAILCWVAGFRILEVWSGEVSLGWVLSLALTVLWIVGITNAFNLIDGMDGLAAGAALFATLALLVLSVVSDYKLSALVLSALAGTILGFLRFNFNPASIFLGDSGSYLLGFVLALISIRYSQKSTAAFAIAIPVVALGLPVLDTALAVARRFVKGKPIFSADGRHIHHLLVQRGLKPRHAVILLYGISGFFGLVSLCFVNPTGKTNGVILAILGLCVLFGVQQLRYSELHGLRGHLSRGLQNQRRLVAGSVVVGNILEQTKKAESIDAVLRAIGFGLEELCFSRFDLIVRSDSITVPAILDKRWEVIPVELGGMVFRWNSLCKSCSRVKASNDYRPEFSCDGCESLKNPILQKNIHLSSYGQSESGFEYQLMLPLSGENGSELGILRFYHPATDDYPVSAISILSQNIVKEFEKVLQRIMSKDLLQNKESNDAGLVQSEGVQRMEHFVQNP